MKRAVVILFFLAAVVATGLFLSQLTLTRVGRKPGRAEELLQQRAELDKEVWHDEVLAQEYEDVFVKLWDDLRASETKHRVISDFPFDHIELGTGGGSESNDLGIKIQNIGAKRSSHSHDNWKTIVREFHEQGYRIIETEWHHSRFQPGPPVHSTISFQLHVTHPKKHAFFIVRGYLEVEWHPRMAEDKCPPRPKEIRTQDLQILERQGAPAFTKAFSTLLKADVWPVVLVHDMDGDGLSEIVLPRTNQVLRNLGGFKFRDEQLLPMAAGHVSAALLADFNGDGKADLVCAGQETLVLYLADQHGKFGIPRQIDGAVAKQLLSPYVLSAGDLDGDGDLDLWVAQYKGPYKEGQMPTPYYDANDGFPSFLLRNDGKGTFTDITESAGLGKKRFRRTYGGSLVDIDNDRDLDLVVASDFAGLDVYVNNGKGQFTDITERFGDDRHSFGMSLSFADYDLDNSLDFFLVGMSSTTARRLERLGLGRSEFPEHQKKRMLMGYGNRMFLSDGKGDFQVPKFNDDVARTGWSWGCASFDFDNDGDSDIYVANGHISKSTAKNYCTQFWRHDIYTAR